MAPKFFGQSPFLITKTPSERGGKTLIYILIYALLEAVPALISEISCDHEFVMSQIFEPTYVQVTRLSCAAALAANFN